MSSDKVHEQYASGRNAQAYYAGVVLGDVLSLVLGASLFVNGVEGGSAGIKASLGLVYVTDGGGGSTIAVSIGGIVVSVAVGTAVAVSGAAVVASGVSNFGPNLQKAIKAGEMNASPKAISSNTSKHINNNHNPNTYAK